MTVTLVVHTSYGPFTIPSDETWSQWRTRTRAWYTEEPTILCEDPGERTRYRTAVDVLTATGCV